MAYPYRNYFFKEYTPEDPFKRPYNKVMFEDTVTEPFSPHKIGAPGSPSQSNDLVSIYEQILAQREGPAQTRYLEYLNRAPKEDDFRPGKMTRLGAALAGAAAGAVNGPMAGYSLASEVVDAPYNRALRRYDIEGRGLREAASIEERSIGNRIGLVKDITSAKQAADQLELNRRNIESQIKARDLTMQQTLVEIKNKGLESHLDKNTGILYIVDRLTNSRTPVGKFDQSTGERVAEERGKIDYTGDVSLKNQRTLAGEAFKRALELEGVRQDFTTKRDSQQQRNALFNIGARAAADAAAPNSQTFSNQLKRNETEVEALVKSNPDRYKGVVEEDDGVLVLKKITDVKEKDQQAFREIYNILYRGIREPLGDFVPPKTEEDDEYTVIRRR